MKLKDMNLKERDAVQRTIDGNVGVFDGVGLHFALPIGGFHVWKPSEIHGDDWQLLTAHQEPVLGEAVTELKPSTDYFLVLKSGDVRVGTTSSECTLFFRDKQGGFGYDRAIASIHNLPASWLPALPKEKTLREKVQKVLEDHYGSGAIANRKEVAGDILNIPEIAALLKGAEHE